MKFSNSDFIDMAILTKYLMIRGLSKAVVNLARGFVDQGFKVDLILLERRYLL